MSDLHAREWRFYIEDMIRFAERVIAYTEGLDQKGFIGSSIDNDTLWSIVVSDVPALLVNLRNIVKPDS